ncbi:MAG TPA: hypothetical protein VN698_10325 [Bacteroidia bacterium]|nr:hypothetical protein [Bacteroidia bacterium]
MATNFHLEDRISYLFGDALEYKVVATKEQPRARDIGFHSGKLPEGFDYLIVKLPITENIINPFIAVREAHIELVKK